MYKTIDDYPDCRSLGSKEYEMPKGTAVEFIHIHADVSRAEAQKRVEKLKFIYGKEQGWPYLYRPSDIKDEVYRLTGRQHRVIYEIREQKKQKPERVRSKRERIGKKSLEEITSEQPKKPRPKRKTELPLETTSVASYEEPPVQKREYQKVEIDWDGWKEERDESLKGRGATPYANSDTAALDIRYKHNWYMTASELEAICKEFGLYASGKNGKRYILDTTLRIAIEYGIFQEAARRGLFDIRRTSLTR